MTKSTSTELATEQANEVSLTAAQESLEAQLAAENQSDVDTSDLQIPLLKIGQALTQEVADGEARPGEFINSLTREGLGTTIEFVVASKTKGRFDHGDRAKGERARKAYAVKNVPWVGDKFYGLPFTEHPDAEEQYAARVNRGEIEWGKGPRISTTYDFYGHVVSGLEEGEEPIPVCLSLMRLNGKQAKKWITILDVVLRGRYWDKVFVLSTEQQRGSEGGNFYTVNVKQGRKTDAAEKQRATGLALAVKHQNVAVTGEDDSEAKPAAAPDAAGGLEV